MSFSLTVDLDGQETSREKQISIACDGLFQHVSIEVDRGM
jgi:hypothetical protein